MHIRLSERSERDMKKRYIISISIVNLLLFLGTIVFSSGAAEYIAERFFAKIYMNGEEISFHQPIVTIDDRTYVPLRELSEHMDLDVEWNGNDNTINLTQNEPILKLSVFAVAVPEKTYVLTLYSDGKLKVSFGRRTSEDITKKGYLYPEKTETKLLWPGPEMQEIRRLLNEISPETDYSDRYNMTDWWDVDFYYDGTVYQYNYSIQNAPYGSPHMTELINKLLDLSPMELDIHGFA